MPTFAFSGRTRAGEIISGERLGDTVESVTASLRREQIMVTRIGAVQAKAGGGAEEGAGQERQRQEPGGVHPPVLGDDRRRPAAGAVSRHPRQPGGGQELRRGHPRHPDRRRGRRLAGRRDAEAPEDLRPAVHQHDRRRRSRRHPRHHPQAPGHLHREGGQAEGPGQVGDDLPGGDHRHRGAGRHRHSVEGHPDLRQPVRRSRRRAAAADPHRHRACQTCWSSSCRSSSSPASR